MSVKIFKIFFVIATILLQLTSCGGNGATNNDQGVSFTLFGFFSDSTGADVVTGSSRQLSTDTETGSSSGETVAFLGLQNNIAGQGLRVDSMFLNYYVPGATEQPPATTRPLSLILGPAASTTVTTTLPPTFNVTNARFVQASILPAEITEWLILNSDLLPEPPYTLSINVEISGVTTSGNRLNTNVETYVLQILPAESNTIPPTTTGGGTTTAGIDGVVTTTDTGTIDTVETGTDTPAVDPADLAGL